MFKFLEFQSSKLNQDKMFSFSFYNVFFPFLIIVALSACGGSSDENEDDNNGDGNANRIPVANASNDQSVTAGVLVTLSGSASSDADGDTLSYQWIMTSKPTDSNAQLSDSTLVNPTFTADLDGNYTIELVVNDGTLSSVADSVLIEASTANGGNQTPTSNAGNDQSVTTGALINLSGSSSADPDGDSLSYQWTMTSKPTDSSAQLSDSRLVNPTFTADLDGDYTVELVVNDGTVDSSVDEVSITASTANTNVTMFTIPTFHSMGIYWTPEQSDPNKKVLLEYKKFGTTDWLEGLALKHNPVLESGFSEYTQRRTDKADYRGSLVNLSPNTSYDIRVTLEGTNISETSAATTWSEEFPIGTTITVGDLTTEYVINQSGTEDGYLLIDGTGSTIDVNNLFDQAIRISGNSEYVIIRGFTLKGGKKYGIFFENASRHIVIEDNDISGWGESGNTGFGIDYQGGIHAGYIEVAKSVIQRNKIHHPRSNSNSWAELNNNGNFHPEGPQGITFYSNNEGNNVIRYNEIWSDDDHYFNDAMGGKDNYSWEGFPGPDSDIYGNYVANSWDDGIEAEGSGANVRIWNNYIEETFLPIGNANTSIGPIYIWNNVSGRSYSPPGSEYGQYAAFIKMGYAEDVGGMTGHMYVFNNTILQPNGEGAGGLGSTGESNVEMFQCETKNNILHVKGESNSITKREGNNDNFHDYDLMSSDFPAGAEQNGLTGVPTYESGAPSFNFETKTGNFKLDPSSLGFDGGVIIPNFTSEFQGDAPDIGAHESGTPDIVYGIEAGLEAIQ